MIRRKTIFKDKNKIFNEDNLKTMSKIPSGFIDGIITSPPYNLGRNPNHRRTDQDDYNFYVDNVDNLSKEDYLKIRICEFTEFCRIIKEDGVILYNMSYSKENPMLPIFLMNKIHNETDLTIADIITWKKMLQIHFKLLLINLQEFQNLYM